MKKIIYTIAAAAIALVSCQEREIVPSVNNGQVKVNFDITFAEAGTATKALGETPDLQTLHVAVFDHNGFKVGFQQAEQLGKSGSSYKYTVTLTSSSEPRVLHFIGNCPTDAANTIAGTYGNEMSLISALLTSGDADAYWQRKELSEISENAETAKAAIGTVNLVRNFCKVSMSSSTATFELSGIKVCGVPTSGYIAPYYTTGANAGTFVGSYQDKSYEDLVAAGYIGHVPANAAYTTCATISAYTAPAESGTATAYVYETSKESAPYIIVKGTFKPTSGDPEECFYKVNILDNESQTYSLLRNFNFKAQITNVAKAGYKTEAEAAASAGSGDISVLKAFESATNISDTQSELFVNKTSETVIEKSTIEIKYKYIPDLSASQTVNNEVRTDASDNTKPVEIVLQSGSAIKSYSVSESDEAGFRTISVETVEPGAEVLEQKLIIKGHSKLGTEYNGSTVTRTITISVRPRLLLTASCTQRIDEVEGTSLPVTIGVQSGLPESIFPINLNIEPQAGTLVPATGETLPVATGKSLSGNGKPAYYFVKTLSYAEYSAAPTIKVNGIDYNSVVCNFITNTADASSRIYVNSELFVTADCIFFSGLKKFTDVNINTVKVGANTATTLSFSTADTTPVTISLTDATINGSATYSFTPAAAGVQTINNIVATTYGKPVVATITASDYAEATATRYRSVDFLAKTVSVASFPNAPVSFGSGNSATMDMQVGLNASTSLATAKFAATRTMTDEAPKGTASYSSSFQQYKWTIKLSNFDSSKYSYTYTTGNNSDVAISSAEFTASTTKKGSITVTATNKTTGVKVSSSATSSATSLSGDNAYTYSATGPNATVTVEFNAAVESGTKVYLFYTNGSNTGSNSVLTVQNLETGTSGTYANISFN